ncbi:MULTISPECIES: aminopeptidase [Bacillus cereus group]|uniref:Aminopeptidase n=1 Tax=Bacillus cereus TaxID=1396 RepID=A0AA44TFU9_BACCE|nr:MULTISPECIES: aminopeptidase [Bacillus cereus group]EEL50120.1 Aminopeptidase [Bacillus cereus Rock3-44]PFA19815.1 aminopeptidase [Bacillus cereus]PFN04368.1 aminopeptidase [Bacillus cereus]PFS00673.1 aminopeptidase [Bacillus cereus]PGZ16106.1 aminopeptidase [Bacillus cereus]
MDSRLSKLADILVNHSTKVQPGDHVLIQSVTEVDPLVVREIVKTVEKAGGYAHVSMRDVSVTRQLILSGSEEQYKMFADWGCYRLSKMQVYINLRSPRNAYELADVPLDKLKMYQRIFGKAQSEAVYKTRWVTTRIPNASAAQEANMSTESYEKFYYDVCTLDYNKMSKAMEPLKELMEKTDQVKIMGEGTDLHFSIKGIGVLKGDGIDNIPDGEVYTAPVKESVNGVITFNTVSVHQGFAFHDITLKIKNGKIVEARANSVERINQILDTDEGARYIGEFALAFNPYILHPMNNTLFDEKINGSFHLAIGDSLQGADNGNKSAIHWDLVNIQRPDYGGGEIWFDDVLIRKDGWFVLPELYGLNEGNLKYN